MVRFDLKALFHMTTLIAVGLGAAIAGNRIFSSGGSLGAARPGCSEHRGNGTVGRPVDALVSGDE